MLYVVIRGIEGGVHFDNTVFGTSKEATSYYDKAQLICDNDPDEFGDGDLTIVSRCWLYVADTADQDTARTMVRDGQALLITSYPDAIPDE